MYQHAGQNSPRAKKSHKKGTSTTPALTTTSTYNTRGGWAWPRQGLWGCSHDPSCTKDPRSPGTLKRTVLPQGAMQMAAKAVRAQQSKRGKQRKRGERSGEGSGAERGAEQGKAGLGEDRLSQRQGCTQNQSRRHAEKHPEALSAAGPGQG